MGEQRFLNNTNINDPEWNVGNCTSQTAYLQVGRPYDRPIFCICNAGWTDEWCSTRQPYAPLIRLIATQTIGGILYGLILIYAIAIALNVILRRPISPVGKLRIVACVFAIASIAVRYVWLVDVNDPNELTRRVPYIIQGFVYWLPLGFACFTGVAILALWYALLPSLHC